MRAPGGTSHYSSIGQLGVYYGGRNLVVNPGFEAQGSTGILSPWMAEGPDIHSVEVGGGLAHTGLNDGLIENSSTSWNALTEKITVNPNTSYILTGWVQNDFGTNTGSFGGACG